MKKLLNYIGGKKRGKDARDIERQSMKDDFLREALEGYDEVQGDPSKDIEKLERKILDKTSPRKNRFPIYAVAAGLVLLVSIGILYKLTNDQRKERNLIAFEKSGSNDKNINIPYAINENNNSSNNEKKDFSDTFKVKSQNKSKPLTIVSNQTLKQKIDPKEFIRNIEPESIEEDTDTFENKFIAHRDISAELSQEKVEEPLLSLKTMNRDSSLEPVKKLNKTDQEIDQIYSGDSLVRDSQSYGITHKSFESQPTIGRDNFNTYIDKNLSVKKEKCDTNEVKIVIGFTVSKEGRPKKLHILQSNCDKLANRIIKLIKSGSSWTEGEGIYHFVR
ncbi:MULTISPECIES: hypothetical protein [unclassified Apibacter]|uniref:hypothetical protein n=1 Tax=unclassified Apibacter TaxID=2630820 RepID=UPI0013207F4B|nr:MULTISPECIES: hypothetical protein [unclassified Apibacter]MCX8676442.1 hypothetical protein [Apibacter sp. B3919]MXO23906.1 hypothetical protein [Apibacter sp. B3924]MXO26417.1 hypothetical protein [Apibacter sp. B3813]MXO28369.1 hypothetical protein [Apibacter sp. B3913]MXO30323.1 hypothetical protein [Apibacter sp. B3912]